MLGRGGATPAAVILPKAEDMLDPFVIVAPVSPHPRPFLDSYVGRRATQAQLLVALVLGQRYHNLMVVSISRRTLSVLILGAFLTVASLGLAWDSAATSASNGAGTLTITGIDGWASHTHGGASARLGGVTFSVVNTADADVELAVTRVEFLTGHDCDVPPAEVRSEPAFGGLFVRDGSMTESQLQVTIPAGAALEVDVGFAEVEANYSHCSRFSFRVTFQAGGEELAAIAETNVSRREPYHGVLPGY